MKISMLASLEKIGALLGLGLPANELELGHLIFRALVVFIFGVLLVRLGDRRLLGKNAGFDMLMVVILGSVLSRGINGQAALFPSMAVSGFLVLLHHLMAKFAYKWAWFSRLIKGEAITVVAEGIPQADALRQSNVTKDDLDENLRTNGKLSDVKKVKEARLERNGTISVVRMKNREDD